MIVLAALLFKSTLACAWALALALLVQLPMVYYAKARCIPNDYGLLLRGLWQSARVTLACLALPAVLALPAAQARGTPQALLLFIAAAAMCALAWLAALVWLRHPMAQDAAFQHVYLMVRARLARAIR
jgi:hypothetical protein